MGGAGAGVARGRVAGRRAHGGAAGRAGRRDVFVYFDNDVKVHAPFDAIGLAERVG